MFVSQFATALLLADSGEPNPLDWWKSDLALWTAVVFLILLAVLWKFAWKPLAKGLDRREKLIADQIAEAEQTNQQARQLLADYQQKLADSKQEVRGILDQGRREAEKLGRELLDRAKSETLAERQRSLQQIEAATAGALEELAERGHPGRRSGRKDRRQPAERRQPRPVDSAGRGGVHGRKKVELSA